MKKRIVLPVALTVTVFVLSYIVWCYAPGLRIKLAADGPTYFVESVKHMALIKTAASAAVSALVGAVAYFLIKAGESPK